VTLYHLLTNTFPPLALTRQNARWKGLPDPLPSASDVNAQVSESVARVLTEAMALAADDRPQTAVGMRESLREATGRSLAAHSDALVAFKAQEVERGSFESTLPFLAELPPKESKVVENDLTDLGTRAGEVMELATEKAHAKPAERSRTVNVVDDVKPSGSSLQAPVQFTPEPPVDEANDADRAPIHAHTQKTSARRRWLVAVIVLIAIIAIGVWVVRSGKLRAPTVQSVQENGEPQTYTETAGGAGIEMVRVPAGRFTMGSPDSEAGHSSDEGPQHTVAVASFYLGKYEVTQAAWRTVAKGMPKVKIDLKPDPSRFKGNNLPVEEVSWEDAIEFCDRLSRATGKTYRLPTEAEWEYACRAAMTGSYAGDLQAMGWYEDNSDRKTHQVGVKQPNSFGLYDMYGNVWEWCMDTWHGSYDDAPTDGTAWTGGDPNTRVLRGGSWISLANHCRSAYRIRTSPDYRYFTLGFRVVAGARTP
jgi:formylglycine-generating enzyme required for sulfatase activity